VGIEVNWFGTANPTEHSFHNTDRFLREQGFALFELTYRRYSRSDMPAPFEYEMYAQTRFGQPYQGDAIYLRDLAADYNADEAAGYPPDKLIKLACISELAGLPHCLAEVLNRFELRLAEFGWPKPLLDALTPPLLGEQLSYEEYMARFKHEPDLFLPSAAASIAPTSAAAAGADAGAPVAAVTAARGLAHRLERRICRQVRSLRRRRVRPAALAARPRSDFLQRAPAGVVHSVAAGLGRARPLALDPAWHFHAPADDAGALTVLRRDIWPITATEASRRRSCSVGTTAPAPSLPRQRSKPVPLCPRRIRAERVRVLRTVLGTGMVVLDGGSNEGLFTLYAARRVGPGGTVLAVEPDAGEFQRLGANIELNRLDNVTTLNAARGSRVGEAVLAVAGATRRDERDRRPVAGRAATRVDHVDGSGVGGDDRRAGRRSGLRRLDLVKLDIEGSEVDAIDGASTTISQFHPLILL
jgi:FkbM family methyltransferase